MQQVVKLNGMKCAGCTQNVQARFEKLAGVTQVQVDLSINTATLTTPTPVPYPTLMAALSDTKYTIDVD